MKYQNLKAFQKHLKSAAPDHLCRVYLVAISDDETRTAILHEVIRKPRKKSLGSSEGRLRFCRIFEKSRDLSKIDDSNANQWLQNVTQVRDPIQRKF